MSRRRVAPEGYNNTHEVLQLYTDVINSREISQGTVVFDVIDKERGVTRHGFR